MQSVSLDPRVLNQLAKQQAQLVRKPLDGIILYQNEEGDVADIQADIIGPMDTPFHNGVFRCRLKVDADFPQKPPKGHFLTKIFHPNVAQPSGEICVNTLKKDWDPKKWDIGHILQIIRCLLIVPFPESALNDDAGRLFMESYEDYFSQAKLYTQIHAGTALHKAKTLQEEDAAMESMAADLVPTKMFSLGAVVHKPASINEGSVLGLSQVPNAMTFGQAMPDFSQGAFSFETPGKLEKNDGDAMFAGLGASGKFGENSNQQQLFQQNNDMNAFGSDNGGLFGMSGDGLGIGLGFNGSQGDAMHGTFGKADNCFGQAEIGQLPQLGGKSMSQPFGMNSQPVKAKKKIGGKCRI